MINKLMRFFFHLLYHPLAPFYDLVAEIVSLGQWRSWVKAVIPLIDGQPVLEIGYGPGHLQRELCANGVLVFGVDESAAMARQTAKRLFASKMAMRITRGRAEALPFAAGCFKRVVTTFPAAFIFEAQTANEIFRVLAPGGRAVILLVAWMTGRSLPERFLRGLFQITGQSPQENQPISPRIHAPYHQAGFITREEIIDLPRSRLLVLIAERPLYDPDEK